MSDQTSKSAKKMDKEGSPLSGWLMLVHKASLKIRGGVRAFCFNVSEKLRVKESFERINKDDVLVREYISYESIDKGRREKAALVKTMVKGCAVLESLGVKYWLCRGIVLGLFRDKTFLANDIDIDLSVHTDKDIYEIIRKMPFDVLLTTNCRGRYMQVAFLDRETNVIFDIWFYHDSGDKIYSRNLYGYFWMPAARLQNLRRISFEGKDYPLPDEEWFCDFWYGKNWRQPKKYKTSDWTIPYREDCKGFIYYGVWNINSVPYYQSGVGKALSVDGCR